MAFDIEWIPSQFYTSGKISNEMVIIHHTGSTNGRINSIEGTISWFKPEVWRNENQVSSQYIIAREEQPIIQMVRDLDTAWHAGRSEWVINGILRKDLNDRSIGIELQGDGNLVSYTDFQYDALIWLVRQKMQQFNIPIELIRGHEEISSSKVDPGYKFDWQRFRHGLTSGGVYIPDNGDYDDDVVIFEETDDVYIPSGKGRSFFEKLFDAIFSIFR